MLSLVKKFPKRYAHYFLSNGIYSEPRRTKNVKSRESIVACLSVCRHRYSIVCLNLMEWTIVGLLTYRHTVVQSYPNIFLCYSDMAFNYSKRALYIDIWRDNDIGLGWRVYKTIWKIATTFQGLELNPNGVVLNRILSFWNSNLKTYFAVFDNY